MAAVQRNETNNNCMRYIWCLSYIHYPQYNCWLTQQSLSDFSHQVQLSVSDIETILDTLLFDGKVEKILVADTTSSRSATSGQKKLFRAVSPLAEPTALVKTPCGVCPVSGKGALWLFCTVSPKLVTVLWVLCSAGPKWLEGSLGGLYCRS